MKKRPPKQFQLSLHAWIKILLFEENRVILFYILGAFLFSTFVTIIFAIAKQDASLMFQNLLSFINAILVVAFDLIMVMFLWKRLSSRPIGITNILFYLRKLIPSKKRTIHEIAIAINLPDKYIEKYCDALASVSILRKDKNGKYYWIDELRITPLLK